MFASVKAKLRESALEYALNGLWVFLTGTAVAVLVALWGLVTGVSEKWLYAACAAVVTATLLLAMTAIVVAVRARRERILERIRHSKYVTGSKGFLDHMVNLNVAQAELLRGLERFTRWTSDMTKALVRHGARAGALAAGDTMAGFQARRRIARRAARTVQKHTRKLEGYARAFDETETVWSESALALVEKTAAEYEPSQAPVILEFSAKVGGFGAALQLIGAGLRSMMRSVEGGRGTTQDLDEACDRLLAALRSVIAIFERAERHCGTMVATLEGVVATHAMPNTPSPPPS